VRYGTGWADVVDKRLETAKKGDGHGGGTGWVGYDDGDDTWLEEESNKAMAALSSARTTQEIIE
jgi:hypothetical protein